MGPRSEVVQTKRRACDECRGRKLACSKEESGCARCKREGIKCFYSEQKPMGRPKKTAQASASSDSAIGLQESPPDMSDLPSAEECIDYPMGILDPLSMFADGGRTYQAAGHSTANNQDNANAGWKYGLVGYDMPIDFSSEASLSIDSSFGSPARLDAEGNSSGIPLGQRTNLRKDTPPCNCLASMYLAMSSIQELPHDTSLALNVIRTAANSAQMSLRCERCGTCDPGDLKMTIEGFQNVMLLGTILPTIVDGYKRLLAQVDREAEEAVALGTTKHFSLDQYGGLFDYTGSDCAQSRYLTGAEIDPMEWRSAVRALLRTDLYGHEGVTRGLNGVIAEMEQRQRTRHTYIDRMRDAGLLNDSMRHYHQHTEGRTDKDAFCLRILDAAKVSLKSIVIA